MRKLEVGQVSTTVPSAAKRLSAKSCRLRTASRRAGSYERQTSASPGRDERLLRSCIRAWSSNEMPNSANAALVVQIVGDLGQAFADQLPLVGLGPAGYGNFRVEP